LEAGARVSEKENLPEVREFDARARHDAVLSRLLALNHDRHAGEHAAAHQRETALSSAKGKHPGRKPTATPSRAAFSTSRGVQLSKFSQLESRLSTGASRRPA
jgi:hypothetical protein